MILRAPQWECFVAGPTDTPYEGGVFRSTISFPSDYPLSPVRGNGESCARLFRDPVAFHISQPKMRFTSALWHPNIYGIGAVGLRSTPLASSVSALTHRWLDRGCFQRSKLLCYIICARAACGRGVHLHPAPSRQGRVRVREELRAVVPRAVCGEDSPIGVYVWASRISTPSLC